MAKKFFLPQIQTKRPPATVGKPALKAQVIHFINKPMPGGLPKRTARALLDIEDNSIVPIIRDSSRAADAEAVFYFPGCGSGVCSARLDWQHRRCSTTSACKPYCHRLPVLRHPQTASSNADRASRSPPTTACCFHRVANTLNTSTSRPSSSPAAPAWTSCRNTNSRRFFPAADCFDIHEFLMEKGGEAGRYRQGCATCITTPTRRSESYQPIKVVNELMGTDVALNERCCGESGTLAATRRMCPRKVRFRKEGLHAKARDAKRADGFKGPVKILTSCPRACKAFRATTTTAAPRPITLVVEIAKHVLGAQVDGGVCEENADRVELSRSAVAKPRTAPPRTCKGHPAVGHATYISQTTRLKCQLLY